MALYKYFTCKSKTESLSKYDVLPDPHGPLASIIPSATIEAANESVIKVLEGSQEVTSRSRGQYEVFSPKEKAAIAKYAIEVGVTKAIRKLQKNYPGRPLKEGTIRSWVKKYNAE